MAGESTPRPPRSGPALVSVPSDARPVPGRDSAGADPTGTDRPATDRPNTDPAGSSADDAGHTKGPAGTTRSGTPPSGTGSTGTRSTGRASTSTRSAGRSSTRTRSAGPRSGSATTSGRRPTRPGAPAASTEPRPGRTGRPGTAPTPGQDARDVQDARGARDIRDLRPAPGPGPTPPAPTGPTPTDPDRLTDVDEWGRSEHLRALVRQLTDPVYQHWFRVEWQGLDTIPREGGAMLVANHAGAIPFDAPMIMHGIERDLGRPVYGLADDVFRRFPVVNLAWSRLGGVQAHPENAYRLLREQQQLVTVFPEGADGPGKTFDERYRLRRFGRGGFVQLAMRAGVPIIPLAVIGSEETMPILFKVPALSRLLGLPYVPVTANMVALGPLGLVPFPAKIVIRVLDPVHFEEPPDQPRYSRSRIMDAAEDVRHTIQEALYDMLRHRRSVWTG